MTRIVVVGDTHIRRWEEAHPELRRYVEGAEIAVHCGDWVHPDVVQGFREAARRAVVVHGNSDPVELRRALPYRELIQVDGVRIGVIHPAWGGPEFEPEALLPDFAPEQVGAVDVIMYGHLHVPVNELRDGVRFLNPGQGYPSFLVPGTLAVLTVEDGVAEAEIVEFAPAQ